MEALRGGGDWRPRDELTSMAPFSPRLPKRVRRLFRLPASRARLLQDLDEEMRSHVAMRIDELRARGMSEADAEAEALRRFGDTAGFRAYAARRAARKSRWTRITELYDEWSQDMRFACRQFRTSPGVALVAMLTLALGIGANTAIFSVVDRLLLAPLPYPAGERIVMPMQESDLPFRTSADVAIIKAWQARTHSVEAVAGASEDMFSVRPDGTVDTIPSAVVTANFFPVLGMGPVLGRGFLTEEERPDGQATVAMISYALWQRTYDGRADIVGRTVSLDGRPLTVVGVTPPGLSIPLARTPPPDIWVPAPLERSGGGGSGIVGAPAPAVFVVLRRGVSAETASRELQTVAMSIPEAVRARIRVRAMRAQDFLDPREHRALQVLFAAVGALLLIACGNVANLLLAQAWTRQREFAVRGALGAGRARIIRQVLSESLSLALVSGLLGIGVAWLALRLIVALRPPALDHLAGVRLDPTVLLWTLGVSLTTGMLFGSVPAFFASAQTAGDVLRRETRGGSTGTTSRRIRSALIVLEIAASLVLLVGSGLLVRSFAALQRMPLGFDPRGLVYTDVLLGGREFRHRKLEFRDAIVERLRALPGVTGVAIGVMPGKGYIAMDGLEAEANASGPLTRVPLLGTVFITPDYFRVARIALVEGRLPDSSALRPGPEGRALSMSPEVLVNRALASRLWPNGRVIGARVRVPSDAQADPWSIVVGVVDDTRMPDVRGDVADMQVYSLVPSKLGDVPFLVRTAKSGDDAAPMIKHAIASVHPALYVRPTLSGDSYLRDGLAPTRFAMALITAFAVLALVLATVGLYGVIAYSVSQRTREIGVRMALGADSGAVRRLVTAGALRHSLTGVVIGTVVAAATSHVLTGMLYGVSPVDPFTFSAIALLVTAIAVLASYVPMRRALRIEPTEALRAE
ncbi:MAG TPA: ABC transporter permease [Gemmatimonadaceae bacterium]|nr:ABC transporter permease [Gemmatimonadaceae bacterium]